MKKLILAEKIYAAIQGEGKNLGKPCWLVRLWGCNLACTWCDTMYTWKDKNPPDKKIVTVDELVNVILNKYQRGSRIVWTGGEPAMYLDQIVEAIQKLGPQYVHEIETNGTVELSDYSYVDLFDTYTVSLKRKWSGNDLKKAEKPEIIKNLVKHKNVVWKFVIVDRHDFLDIVKLQHKYGIESEKIYVMSEGTQQKKILDSLPDLIEYGIQYGYNVTPRMHVLAYGPKRYV